MPMPSLVSTCTTGARQFVVHDALETMWCLAGWYSSSLTPMTMVLTSTPLPGAVKRTFLAPAARWPRARSASLKMPVDSMTRSTPIAFQGSSARSLAAAMQRILCPLTTMVSFSFSSGLLFSVVTWPSKRPCTES
jgi:hypothetical protein